MSRQGRSLPMVGRLSVPLAWGLALLMALPVVGAAWTQAQGDAGRNGVAALPGGPLDVVEVARLWNASESRSIYTFGGAGGVATGGGIVFASYGEDRCELVERSVAAAQRLLDAWSPCSFATLVAVDAERDTAFVCVYLGVEGSRLAAVRVSDGERLWEYSWTGGPCLGAAYDEVNERLYLPLTISTVGSARARLDAVDAATGTVLFRSLVPLADPREAAAGLAAATPGFAQYGRGVSITDTGVVFTGYTGQGSVGVYEDMFVAWFGLDGRVRNMEQATFGQPPEGDEASRGLSRAGTQWPVARGALAALGLGDEVVVLQPQTPNVVLRAPLAAVEPTTQGVFWRTGAWGDDVLVLQLPHSLRAFEPATLAPSWTWTESLDHYLQDLMRVAGGTLLVLASAGKEVLLVELDEGTGATRARFQLPFQMSQGADGDQYAILVPIEGDGLYVLGDRGKLLRLAHAPEGARPNVVVSNSFPTPGDRVTIHATVNDVRHASFEIDWGDARFTPMTEGGASRVFSGRAVVDVKVRAIYEDGTTATTVAAVNVGGTPPPKLTALQTAFAPENQDLTFGIVGVGLTLLGAAFTIGRTRARIARLERELDAMEEIRLLSARDPREAVRTLRDYRQALPQEMARGRIDESHYHVLEARSARLLRVLRARLVTPYADRFSPRYQRVLEAAFEDATLGPAEWALLTEGLDTEGALSDEERRELRELLSDFLVGAAR